MRTAEEILRERVYITKDDMEDIHDSISSVAEVMIKFAKIHVTAALIAASENADLLENGDKTYASRYIVEAGNHYSETEIDVNKNSITLAYSLDLIK